MTTALRTDASGERQNQPQSWGNITASLAGQIAQFAQSRRGDLADLRRMDPDTPDRAAFWRLMAEQHLLGAPAVEVKWALILHGIALMTRTGGDKESARSAHDGQMPVGRALYLGGEGRRESGFYSETRINRLLTARGPMLRTLLARTFRMLAAANVSFDWREMGRLILNDGHDEGAAEVCRSNIARDYYRAAYRSSKDSGG